MPRSLAYVISITEFVYINVSVILHVCYIVSFQQWAVDNSDAPHLTYKIYYRRVVLQIEDNNVTITLMVCVIYVTEI